MRENIIVVPFTRPVTYSFEKVPKEVPVEIRSYFPEGFADSATMVVEFDGNKYHLFDATGSSKKREAINIVTGDIVTLDFTEAISFQ